MVSPLTFLQDLCSSYLATSDLLADNVHIDILYNITELLYVGGYYPKWACFDIRVTTEIMFRIQNFSLMATRLQIYHFYVLFLWSLLL